MAHRPGKRRLRNAHPKNSKRVGAKRSRRLVDAAWPREFRRAFPALSFRVVKKALIAQILAVKPKLLLMDEPFAALDAIVRTRITQELLNWVEREHLSVLLVTHDLEEALTVSDTVYLLSQGPRAYVLASYDVTIPRPRNILACRKHPTFAPLFERLWQDMAAAMNFSELDAIQ